MGALNLSSLAVAGVATSALVVNRSKSKVQLLGREVTLCGMVSGGMIHDSILSSRKDMFVLLFSIRVKFSIVMSHEPCVMSRVLVTLGPSTVFVVMDTCFHQPNQIRIDTAR